MGGTVACTKRLMMATKGCDQLTSNDIYFADICFSGVKTDEEEMTEGVDYCGLAKMSHKDFCLATLAKLMKEWPVGSYIVIIITPRIPGDRHPMSIGYKYKYRSFLGFIANEGYGSTKPGYPYLSRFPKICYNVSIFPVVLTNLLGRYFNACAVIVNHDRMRQSDLALDK